ncbi:MAG: hypothetical protein M1821_009381 [Bathelium mastoideum]|nr:MAG: hypothetical protein M1821_009381 [Bathelium mastoideum]
MASQKTFLPPYSPIEFSLTKGTAIPSPPATPPKPEPITRQPSRPPTPGRGPLNSHPTTPVDLKNLPASPAASQTHTPTASPPPGVRVRKGSNLRASSYDMLSPHSSSFTTTVSSPGTSSQRHTSEAAAGKRSFLGLRRLSGAFDTNIRLSNDDHHPHDSTADTSTPLAAPRPLRPFSPVGGLISSFKPRSRTSSLNTGTTAMTAGTEDTSTYNSNHSNSNLGGGAAGPGLRKKKSASWFRRRMSGMPLGVGVETVEEHVQQLDGKGGESMDVDSVVGGQGAGWRQGGYVTDLERRVTQEEEARSRTPPPQLPDLGTGIGLGTFAGEDGGEDLFGSIR